MTRKPLPPWIKKPDGSLIRKHGGIVYTVAPAKSPVTGNRVWTAYSKLDNDLAVPLWNAERYFDTKGEAKSVAYKEMTGRGEGGWRDAIARDMAKLSAPDTCFYFTPPLAMPFDAIRQVCYYQGRRRGWKLNVTPHGDEQIKVERRR